MLPEAVGARKESERRSRAFTVKSRSVHFLYHPSNIPIRVGAIEPYHPRRQLRHAKTPARDASVTLRPTRTAARAARSSFHGAKRALGRTAYGSVSSTARASRKPATRRHGDARACAAIGRHLRTPAR